MKTKTFPRNGQYELFIYKNKVHCFDDPDWTATDESEDLHTWVRNQPSGWYNMEKPHDRTAYYLDPKLYLMFKLKFS